MLVDFLFNAATFLYHAKKLRLALLFLILNSIKCVLKQLYTTRKGGWLVVLDSKTEQKH